MDLLPQELEGTLPPLYAQDGKGDDAMVHAKYFHPLSSWTLYVLEYDPQERIFFGWGGALEPEYGYTSLDEMQSVVVMGLGIERDLHWTPKTLREVWQEGDCSQFCRLETVVVRPRLAGIIDSDVTSGVTGQQSTGGQRDGKPWIHARAIG